MDGQIQNGGRGSASTQAATSLPPHGTGHKVDNNDMEISAEALDDMDLCLRAALGRVAIIREFNDFERIAKTNRIWHCRCGVIALVTLIGFLIFAVFRLVAFAIPINVTEQIVGVALIVGMIPLLSTALMYFCRFRENWVLARYKAERIRHWTFHQLLDGRYISDLGRFTDIVTPTLKDTCPRGQLAEEGLSAPSLENKPMQAKPDQEFIRRWNSLLEELNLGEGSLQSFIGNDDFTPAFTVEPYADPKLFEKALECYLKYRLRIQLHWFTQEEKRYSEADKTTEGAARSLLFLGAVMIFVEAACHFIFDSFVPKHLDIVLSGIGIALTLLSAGVRVYRSASGVSENAERYQNMRIQLIQLRKEIGLTPDPTAKLKLMKGIERICHGELIDFLRISLKSDYLI